MKERGAPKIEGLKGPFGCLKQARYGVVWSIMGAFERQDNLQ